MTRAEKRVLVRADEGTSRGKSVDWPGVRRSGWTGCFGQQASITTMTVCVDCECIVGR